MAKKRSLGGQDFPPVLTAVISLQNQNEGSCAQLIKALTTCSDDVTVTKSTSCTHIAFPRFKQRFSFIVRDSSAPMAALDAAKVCDNVLFILSALETNETGFAEEFEPVLGAVLAQGLSTSPVFVLKDLDQLAQKKQNDAKKAILKALNKRFPVEKLYICESESEGVLLLRHLGQLRHRANSLRDNRSYLISEESQFIGESSTGTLKLTGYVRSQTFSANRLVHVPGLGTYQVEKIESSPDPHPLNEVNKRSKAGEVTMGDEEVKVIAVPDEDAENLITENEPDAFDGEQYLGAEDEAMAAEAIVEDSKKKKTIRVPKGTSEYQAAWIMDQLEDGDEEDEDDEDDDSEDEDMIEAEEEDVSEGEEEDAQEEYETMTVTSEADLDANYDEKHFDEAEERETLQQYKEARTDAMFPDEVDTPVEVPARVRFQKYRGLASFRSSPWDPYENLPPDYARIFQFENFNRTKKRVLTEEAEGAEAGWYVSVYLKDVPAQEAKEAMARGPLAAFNMLPHENKMSVINVVVKRHSLGHCDPIKSKTRLIFHVGYRRFAACPVFSQHTNGGKHKLERYWREGATVVMTMFAPITFPPGNVLVYHETVSGGQDLVGTGSLLSVDPNRLVIKRAVLSGAPFKLTKRKATVRFMFFNREDINWFKPVELRTKYGRRGHIREPLGTHGHMKCIFDNQLSQQDTVLLNLYKRVFPKWTYDPYVPVPAEKADLMEEDQGPTLQLTKKKKKTSVSTNNDDMEM